MTSLSQCFAAGSEHKINLRFACCSAHKHILQNFSQNIPFYYNLCYNIANLSPLAERRCIRCPLSLHSPQLSWVMQLPITLSNGWIIASGDSSLGLSCAYKQNRRTPAATGVLRCAFCDTMPFIFYGYIIPPIPPFCQYKNHPPISERMTSLSQCFARAQD